MYPNTPKFSVEKNLLSRWYQNKPAQVGNQVFKLHVFHSDARGGKKHCSILICLREALLCRVKCFFSPFVSRMTNIRLIFNKCGIVLWRKKMLGLVFLFRLCECKVNGYNSWKIKQFSREKKYDQEFLLSNANKGKYKVGKERERERERERE